MRSKIFIVALVLTGLISCQKSTPTAYELVDPFIGTGGHGHTFPGSTLPFGMVQLSPDTRLEGWDGCSGYHNSDSVIYGFSHTHLSGTGVGDYGDVLIMPSRGDILFNNGLKLGPDKGYASSFDKSTEQANPGYYKVELKKHNILARMTSTRRCGIHEYTFEDNQDVHFIVDLDHRDQLIDFQLDSSNSNELIGKRISKAWAQEQHIYFVMQFSQEIQQLVYDSSKRKVAVLFDEVTNDKMMVKVGISANDIDGARKNLEAEAGEWDFEVYRAKAREEWQVALNLIEAKDQDQERLVKFYTALYHSMIAPNTFSDVDHRYRGMDMKVHEANHDIYTVFSLWDTYRATHPLFTIIEQKRTIDFINTFLKQYKDGGELPIWELAANYTGCMIGYHAIPVIVDAYLKGLDNFDADIALEAMLKSADNDKLGLGAYKRKGYIGMGDESESVSKTLEYAYDDWCIAMMAKKMGKQDIYERFIKRAQNYQNIFNPNLGFVQSKINGSWSPGFDPTEVNFNFTEANSWQYSMYMPQDVEGMIRLYGGEEKFYKKLDELFSTEMELSGRHQADITGLIGQYAHGNEPSHHMAYLYNYIGKQHRTQELVNRIMNELYTTEPDGLSGNEDCGQMSSWFVMSAMGFYPVVPGSDQYIIGTPHLSEFSINLENGNQFSIKAKELTDENMYIQNISLNGESLNRYVITHSELMKGGEMIFYMGPKPKKHDPLVLPSSSIDEEDRIPAVPFFEANGLSFKDSLQVSLQAVDEGDSLYISTNGSAYTPYLGAITINEPTSFSAYTQKNGKRSPIVKNVKYNKIHGNLKVLELTEFSNQYNAGGRSALIDGIRGPNNFRTGFWQGFYGKDVEVVIDLGEEQSLSSVSLGALQDIKSWIWFPSEIHLSVSRNGKSYAQVDKIKNPFPADEYGSFTKEFRFDLSQPLKVKYIKLKARNFGQCPDWHLGAGNDTWLFLDEITVNNQ